MAQCVSYKDLIPNERDKNLCLSCAEKLRVQEFMTRGDKQEEGLKFDSYELRVQEFMTRGDKQEEGLKFDSDKLDWSLMPMKQLDSVVQVLMVGAAKYAPDNWKKVPDPDRRYLNALYRHINKVADGQWLDEETNLPHLSHAICNALFLLWFVDDKERSTNSTQE